MSDIDWTALGQRLSDAMTRMMHTEQVDLHGAAFYGEAMRRVVTTFSSGLTTEAEAQRVIESHTAVDRANRESAEREVARLHAELARARAGMAAEMAEALAAAAENRNLEPSKYRREGIAHASRIVLAHAEYEQRVAAQQSAKAAP